MAYNQNKDPALVKAQNTINKISEQIIEDPNTLAVWLDIQARLNAYSAFNTMLIVDQMPDASQLADKKSWNKRNVTVKKDAQAIDIMAPEFDKVSGRITYKIKQVYDVSQTSQEFEPGVHQEKGYQILTKALEGLKKVPYIITDDTKLIEYNEKSGVILVNPKNKHSNRAFFNGLVYAVAKSLIKDWTPTTKENEKNQGKIELVEMWNESEVVKFNCACIAYMMDSRYLKPDKSYYKTVPDIPPAYEGADKWQVRNLFEDMRKLYSEFVDAVMAVEAGVPVKSTRDRKNGEHSRLKKEKDEQQAGLQ